MPAAPDVQAALPDPGRAPEQLGILGAQIGGVLSGSPCARGLSRGYLRLLPPLVFRRKAKDLKRGQSRIRGFGSSSSSFRPLSRDTISWATRRAKPRALTSCSIAAISASTPAGTQGSPTRARRGSCSRGARAATRVRRDVEEE